MIMRPFRLTLLLAAALVATVQPVAAQNLDVLLEAEFEPTQVYVQAQAIYRLRFYQAVDVRELKINGPSARLADLRPLGPDRIYEAQRDGRRYRVHERSYAVFPFSSGPLQLSGAHVLGRIATTSAKSADGRQLLRIDAPARTLTVHPAPVTAGAVQWLPASSLSLSESWTHALAEIHPGQVQRRSIRIEAAGVDASQIPPMQIAADGLLVEAEPPRLENRLAGKLNIGVREQSFKLVALRAGELLLPELQLLWWNVDTNAMASASLPARRLHIVAGAVQPDAAPLVAGSPSTPAVPAQPQPPWLAWLAAPALLVTGSVLAYVRRPGVRAAWRLQRACRLGTAAAMRDGLLQWAAAIWPQNRPLTLAALAMRLPDPAAHQALASIERSLYGPAADLAAEPAAAAPLAAAVHTVKHNSRQWRRQCRQDPPRQAEYYK
jgi:hypothetical protein